MIIITERTFQGSQHNEIAVVQSGHHRH